MKFDARTLNLFGLLGVVAILGLGAVLVVMPLYEKVQIVESELDAARDSNVAYQNSLIGLHAAEARQDEIQANVEEMRERMPAELQQYTALDVIVKALDASGAVITSDSYGVPEAYLPRVGVGEDESAAPPAAATTPPATDPTSEDVDAASAQAEAAQATQTQPSSEQEPRQQAVATVNVEVESPEMATHFLNQLSAGPRALLVTAADLSRPSVEGPYTLTVTLTMFYYGTGAQS